MFRNSLFDNPIIIFIMLIFVSLSNILTSIYFLYLLFAGLVFTAFLRALDKKYYYSLTALLITFLIIETNQGLPLFSLSLWSLFIYIFILPLLKFSLTSSFLSTLLLIFIFYFGMIVLFKIVGNITTEFISRILLNYVIDIIIVGLII
jgi:hypothetical protein